jgi:hypothetical protein
VPIASPTLVAIGSTRPFQVGMVRVSHSARLQAWVRAVADGRSLARSSQRSAVRSASATARWSVSETDGSPPSAVTCRAMSWARSQLTGPSPPEASSCCTWASMACSIAGSVGIPGSAGNPGGSWGPGPWPGPCAPGSWNPIGGRSPASPVPPAPPRARNSAASGSSGSSGRSSGSLLMVVSFLTVARVAARVV